MLFLFILSIFWVGFLDDKCFLLELFWCNHVHRFKSKAYRIIAEEIDEIESQPNKINFLKVACKIYYIFFIHMPK